MHPNFFREHVFAHFGAVSERIPLPLYDQGRSLDVRQMLDAERLRFSCGMKRVSLTHQTSNFGLVSDQPGNADAHRLAANDNLGSGERFENSQPGFAKHRLAIRWSLFARCATFRHIRKLEPYDAYATLSQS